MTVGAAPCRAQMVSSCALSEESSIVLFDVDGTLTPSRKVASVFNADVENFTGDAFVA